MKILCVIPSRLGSTRLPRKPLLPLGGKPMVQHVYENARRCPHLTEVVVATDAEDIAAVIQAAGGKTLLTDPALPTGSHRTAAVAEHYPDMDIIINLQGDEPFVTPQMLEELITPWLAGENPDMTTLASPLDRTHNHASPHAVKVILDQQGHALYFSRAPIPYFRESVDAPVFHHIGLYAFRRDFLRHYVSLTDTPLGKAEQLEQLRVLEHGHKIRVCLTEGRTLEINTPEEYAAAEARMATA
jgi:3-deoxy-manno-octulosonate cytidylyltransferase (CMP-KDO synthetase)